MHKLYQVLVMRENNNKKRLLLSKLVANNISMGDIKNGYGNMRLKFNLDTDKEIFVRMVIVGLSNKKI